MRYPCGMYLPQGSKIHFLGSFAEYFLKALLLGLLTVVTFGLAAPYALYWSLKYFFTQLRVEGRPVVYTGSFGEYFVISFLLFLLSAVTFGLAAPYWAYWSFKYFFDHLVIADAPEPPLPSAGNL